MELPLAAAGEVDVDVWLDESRLDELIQLCRRFRVRRLDVFGSAAGPGFDPASSDVDLLVQFDEMPPAVYADSYFGLWEALEALLGRSVDLVTADSVTNPYFRKSLSTSRRSLYAA